MSVSVGLAAYKLSTQLSPIILNNGIANNIPFKMLPIIAITEALNFLDGILSGGQNIGLDDFFANYVPVPGGTLINQTIGEYPFANQAIAANAVIAQPLQISLLMICPVRQEAGYALKLAIMLALQKALQQHNLTGGTYTIITPAAFYDNCIMTGMSDASNSESKQVQNAWRLDFRQPLLTQSQAAGALQALNGRMGAVQDQIETTGASTGAGSGTIPAGAMTAALIPSASGAVSGSTAVAPILQGFHP